MLRGMDNVKEGFCERDHYTLQEARNQLHILLTDIIMDNAGYIIDKVMDEAKKEMAKLRNLINLFNLFNSINSINSINLINLFNLINLIKLCIHFRNIKIS